MQPVCPLSSHRCVGGAEAPEEEEEETAAGSTTGIEFGEQRFQKSGKMKNGIRKIRARMRRDP